MKKIKIVLGMLLLPVLGISQSSDNGSGDFKKGFVGARFMPTITSINVREVNNSTVKANAVLGYGFGAVLGYNFSKHVGVQGEVIYSALRQKYTISERKQQLDLSYVNIPVMLSLNTNSSSRFNINVVAGPQLGINTGSKFKSEGSEVSDTLNAVVKVKPADLGLAYGAGIDIGLTSCLRLGLGFRGVYGLLDISDKSNSATSNQ